MLDDTEGLVFRPPNEANSFILRVSIGCSHNLCTFCAMYKNVDFRIRSQQEIYNVIEKMAIVSPNLRRVFLADGNALALPTNYLLQIIEKLHKRFPKLTRVNCYGGPRDILAKSPDELAALRSAGLHTIYLGIESGDDTVLQMVRKGVTANQIVKAGIKVINSGITLSTMVISGLGGRALSTDHAINTAAVINEIKPNMLNVLSLMIYETTPLYTLTQNGLFTPLTAYETLEELKLLLSSLELKNTCLFRSNHISNLVPLSGALPADKHHLLSELNKSLLYYSDKPFIPMVREEL